MNKRKPNPRSRMAVLSEKDLKRVYEHCETVTIKDGCAWLLAEFNLVVSDPTLSRWLIQKRAEENFKELLDTLRGDAKQAQEVAEVVGGAADFTEATVIMLGQALFETLRMQNGKPNDALRKKAADQFAMVLKAATSAKVAELKRTRSSLRFRNSRLPTGPGFRPGSRQLPAKSAGTGLRWRNSGS